MPNARIRSSRSGIRLAPSRREYSLWVWRWTNGMPLPRSGVQLLEHAVEGKLPGFEQHDEMIQQVRRLAREARPVLGGGGDHCLDRLLADLLGDLGHPVSEEPRRVGPRRLVAGALGDRAGEPREGAAARLAEAGGGARVTGRSLLAHDVQYRVAIAVHADVFDGLRVPGGRALLPQLAARAAAVVGLAGRARPLQGLAVGVRHHQHLARERALRDDGDESIVPEAHGLNPIVGGGGHPLNLSALARIVKIPDARISLRPMGWVASLGVLGLMMALLHRLTAGRPVEARATLALGFLLLAALAGGDLAKRVRLPRITGALLIGFAAGPAWLGLIRRDEVDALQLVADAAVALIALAAGAELTLETVRAGRAALARLATGAIAFPFAVVTLVAWSVSRGLPIAAHQPWLDRLSVALVLGALAAAASPAITLAMIDEMRARGPLARSLLAVTVAQDVAVPILFTAVLLGSKALASAGALQLTVAGVAALELAGSLAVGVAIGALLAQYTRLLRGPEAAWLVAAALLAAVAARLLRLEPLLIGLAAGVYLENFSPVERGRLGHDLNRTAPVVYIIFFALMGAGLQLGVLAQLWPWALLLAGLRGVSLRYGPLWAARPPAVTPVPAPPAWLGLISPGGTDRR